jgi:hypothetical protein
MTTTDPYALAADLAHRAESALAAGDTLTASKLYREAADASRDSPTKDMRILEAVCLFRGGYYSLARQAACNLLEGPLALSEEEAEMLGDLKADAFQRASWAHGGRIRREIREAAPGQGLLDLLEENPYAMERSDMARARHWCYKAMGREETAAAYLEDARKWGAGKEIAG